MSKTRDGYDRIMLQRVAAVIEQHVGDEYDRVDCAKACIDAVFDRMAEVASTALGPPA